MLDPEAADLIGNPVGTNRRHANLGPLHDLLLRASRKDEKGMGSIRFIAQDLGMTTWGVYKWFKKNNNNGVLPVAQAKRIVAMSEGRVTFEDFIPYLG